jgi:hypothetical protein
VLVTCVDAFGNTGADETAAFCIIPSQASATNLGVTLDNRDPVVSVTCPTTDSVFVRGDLLPIRWTTTETNTVADSCTALDWRREPMAAWQGIATGQTDDDAYDWVTPADSTNRAVVRLAVS